MMKSARLLGSAAVVILAGFGLAAAFQSSPQLGAGLILAGAAVCFVGAAWRSLT
jgi:hypothetical protein